MALCPGGRLHGGGAVRSRGLGVGFSSCGMDLGVKRRQGWGRHLGVIMVPKALIGPISEGAPSSARWKLSTELLTLFLTHHHAFLSPIRYPPRSPRAPSLRPGHWHLSTPLPRPTPQGSPLVTMLKARQSRGALKSFNCAARRFSSTPSPAAVSPYRNAAVQQSAQKPVVKNAIKRTQSTAAAQQTERPVPAPAFNRDDPAPQVASRYQPQMDHSFVGMKGGEIFHEMMLRQGVKHICTLHFAAPSFFFFFFHRQQY